MIQNDDLEPIRIPIRKMLQFKIKEIVIQEQAMKDRYVRSLDYQIVNPNDVQQHEPTSLRFVPEKIYPPVIKQKSQHIHNDSAARALESKQKLSLSQKSRKIPNNVVQTRPNDLSSQKNLLQQAFLQQVRPRHSQEQMKLFDRIMSQKTTQTLQQKSDGHNNFFPKLVKDKVQSEIQSKIDHYYKYYKIEESEVGSSKEYSY